MGTASAVGEEVAVAAVKARQLGLPCCFACRAAASVKTMAMAKPKAKFAAPPGAGKVDDGSGALLRSSGSATLSDRPVGLLDAPPGAVMFAAPPGAGEVAAPPGAGKGAVGSDAFFICGQRSGPAGICVSSQEAAKAL
jgi:hypothetical protein